MLGRNLFSQLFKTGEVIESGAGPNRKNAACLKILSIEDDFVRYQSIRNASKSRIKYSYLQILLDGFESLDRKSIQKSVNRVLKKAGFKPNYSTENYAFSFANAIQERMKQILFLSEGESHAVGSSQPSNQNYTEGDRVAVLVERVERDHKARLKCIEHYGAWCRVCEIDFEKMYGSIGRGFIHVHHHRKQLASTRGKHKVDPIKDLIPLCPNCHAMAHSSDEMLTVAELRKHILEAAGRNKSV